MEYNKKDLNAIIRSAKNGVIEINNTNNKNRVENELKILAARGEDTRELQDLLNDGEIVVVDKLIADIKADKINKKARNQVLQLSIAVIILILTSPFITSFVIDKGFFFIITNTVTVLIGLIVIVGIKVLYESIRIGLFFKDGVNSAINSNFKHIVYSFGFLTTFMYVTYKLINLLIVVSK